MGIKPIRTKTDYNKALRSIDRLLYAKPKSPQADDLEVLTVLVEDYNWLFNCQVYLLGCEWFKGHIVLLNHIHEPISG